MVGKCTCPSRRSRRIVADFADWRNPTINYAGAAQTTATVAGKQVTVSAGSQADLDAAVAGVVAQIDQSFAPGEIPDNLHIDLGVDIPGMGGDLTLGKYVTVDGVPHILVGNTGEHAWLANRVVTHELVHAQQEKEGRDNPDMVIEEIETELEALARAPYSVIAEMMAFFKQRPDLSCTGYWCWYREVGDNKNGFRYLLQDREMLTGSLERHLTGSDVARRVRQVYHQTHLAHIGRILAIHGRFPPPKRSQRRAPRYIATVSRRATRLKAGKVRRAFIVRTKKGERSVTVDAGRDLPVAVIGRSLRAGLGATAVWVCKNCKKVRVA